MKNKLQNQLKELVFNNNPNETDIENLVDTFFEELKKQIIEIKRYDFVSCSRGCCPPTFEISKQGIYCEIYDVLEILE